MNCARFRKDLIRFEDSELPPDFTRHLEGCSACRKHVGQVQALRKLISLKQYERPSVGFEERLVAAVHRRIEHPEVGPEPGRVWEVLTGWPLPAFRYALAAVFAVLVGVHLFSIPALSPLPPIVAENRPPSPAPRVAPFPFAPAPAPAAVPIALASTGGPDRIEYGPLPSSLVDFEF